LTTPEVQELDRIAAQFREARFGDHSFHFHPEKREFRLECWLRVRAHVRQSLWTHKWSRMDLIVGDVTECLVHQQEHVEYYELSTIYYSLQTRTLKILCHYAIWFELVVDRLAIGTQAFSESKFNW